MTRYQAADAERCSGEGGGRPERGSGQDRQARPVEAAEASIESNGANVQRLVQLTGFQRIVAPFSGTSSSGTWTSER